jgi:outer membrane phospholipase A
MKKIFILMLFILIALPLFSKEFESPMSPYKDNYIISGDTEEDQVKLQISVKYNLFYPAKTGINFAYTQRSYWRIYDDSSPFVETNYMPEAFYIFESGNNIFGNYVIPYVDYIKASPIYHKSNGRDGLDSRSMNIYYGEIQVSYGDAINIGASGKVYGYYNKAKENEFINDYNKNYEANVFIKHRSRTVQFLDKEEINVRFAGDPTGKGWYEAELKFRILTTYVQPRFFIQYRDGYDEFMINYTEKNRAIRAGLVF